MLPLAQRRGWQVGQGIGLLGLVALLVGLVTLPQTTLRLLWYGFIPLVPAVVLVSPGLWRNICPLATLNVATGRRWGRRAPSPQAVRWMGAAGMALLLVLIPARKLVLDTNAPVLLIFLVAVAAAAITLGFFFDTKAGFCNALCPVLPVERLYGQMPWYEPPNPRCAPCSACTRGGCLDLGPGRAAAQSLGPARDTLGWTRTPAGLFALLFPGVIVGYFTVPEAATASAAATYGHVAWVAAASLGAGLLAVRLLRIRGGFGLGLFGALAFSLYYWFGAPTVVAEMGFPALVTVFIRAASLILIAAWLYRFLMRTRSAHA